jgi:tetratricopeptide (TPR) repeat protein
LDTLGWTLALLADHEKDNEKAVALRSEAAKHLGHSIDLEPSPDNLYHLGWTLEKSGRTKEAIDLYRQALKKVSKDTDPVLRQINEGLKRLAGS